MCSKVEVDLEHRDWRRAHKFYTSERHQAEVPASCQRFVRRQELGELRLSLEEGT